MIKADVTVTGTIARKPVIKKDRQGNMRTHFHLRSRLPSDTGDEPDIDIYVTCPDENPVPHTYEAGQLVQIKGSLSIVIKTDGVNPEYKNDPVLLFFMSASEIIKPEDTAQATVSGRMEFRGKVTTAPELKRNQLGAEYIQFVGIIYAKDPTTSTCFRQRVRFIKYRSYKDTEDTFSPSWLQHRQNVTIHGRISMTSHNGAISIGCLVENMAKYT